MQLSRILLAVVLQWILWISGSWAANASSPLVPAYFIFGDSLVDVGNNNHLFTLAKSNFHPYGVDFDTHIATGRFSNGRVSVDYLTELLGLPFVPAYLDPSTKGSKLLLGVNFASSGSGILDFTGKIFGQNMPMGSQLKSMHKVKQEIQELIGEERTRTLLSKALFSVVTGSNDYLNNYLVRRREGTPAQFQALLLSSLKSQLQELYNIGARKLHVVSMPPIGCCPQSLFKFGSKNGECIDFVNKLAVDYNVGLKSLLVEVERSLPGLRTVYTDSYYSFMSIYNNPSQHGFKVTGTACCGIGPYRGSFFCLPKVPYCSNPSQHIFFDEFHPTAGVARDVAIKAFRGGPDVNHPINVYQLVTSS
ncbi:hypothetical protein SELMODRAFT_230518 [Selaginella moellendorffii]|uniref:Uncharacterized protein n=1 Tax=Selaginella moellendorffii TaxID=88036 RepID=D8R237_SELML|nr:GDSL esterase/lipase At5g08460 [Selaginella moellendorffii]EFJ34001.1 hypothetical protein SELMODRAFT_230518 [Selaginella moellendorffii]|eukprot:XP_002965163.1 GDSL esterase/lipase At5g08460 [Selaginella moellendorffii]